MERHYSRRPRCRQRIRAYSEHWRHVGAYVGLEVRLPSAVSYLYPSLSYSGLLQIAYRNGSARFNATGASATTSFDFERNDTSTAFAYQVRSPMRFICCRFLCNVDCDLLAHAASTMLSHFRSVPSPGRKRVSDDTYAFRSFSPYFLLGETLERHIRNLQRTLSGSAV